MVFDMISKVRKFVFDPLFVCCNNASWLIVREGALHKLNSAAKPTNALRENKQPFQHIRYIDRKHRYDNEIID